MPHRHAFQRQSSDELASKRPPSESHVVPHVAVVMPIVAFRSTLEITAHTWTMQTLVEHNWRCALACHIAVIHSAFDLANCWCQLAGPNLPASTTV